MDYYAHYVYNTPSDYRYCIINEENDYTSKKDILISRDAFDYFAQQHTIYEGKYLSYGEYDEDTFTTLYQVSFEDTEKYHLTTAELLSKKDVCGLDIYRVRLSDSLCGYITAIPNWTEKIKSGKFKLYQVDLCRWDSSLSHYNQLSYYNKSPNAQFTHEYWYDEDMYLKGIDCEIISYQKDFYYNVDEYHREQLYQFLSRHQVKQQVLQEIDKYILFEFVNFTAPQFYYLKELILAFLKELSIPQQPYLKSLTYKINGKVRYEELSYLKQLKGKIVRKAISKKKAFSIELPKWSQYIVNGDSITEEQALEIIRRTDHFFTEEHYVTWDCFEKQVCEICKIPHKKEDTFYRLHDIFKKKWKCLGDFYYFVNDWIYCNSGGAGYHGWCHPDATIGYCNHGYMKYPSVGNFHHELKILGNLFPFLHLYCTIMNADEGLATESIITLELKNGIVTCLEPIPFERLPIRGIKYGDHSSQCHTYFTLDQIKKWADQVYNI